MFAAKDGGANDLEGSARIPPSDNGDLALRLKQQKTHPGNVSQSKKQFEFVKPSIIFT